MVPSALRRLIYAVSPQDSYMETKTYLTLPPNLYQR
jgi:hypothetical protein